MITYLFVARISTCSFLGAASAVVLDGSAHIPLGTAVSVGVAVLSVVMPGALYIGKRLQSVDDRLGNLQIQVDNMPCKDKKKCDTKI